MKSAQRRRKHCALAVLRRNQKISPRRRPIPGARDGQNLIRWRWSLPVPKNRVWWRSTHAISSYRGNRPTPPVRPPTPPVCHRQGRLQYTAPQLSAQCNHIVDHAGLYFI